MDFSSDIWDIFWDINEESEDTVLDGDGEEVVIPDHAFND